MKPAGPAVSRRRIDTGWWRVAGRALLVLWLIWLATSVTIFVYSGVAGATWPSSWPAPWSGGVDFVVMEDSRLAVYISDFDRLQIYSSEGVFEGAWRRVKGYVGGMARLSLAGDGRLFVTASHGRLRSYSRDGRLLDKRELKGIARGWRLGLDGEPVALLEPHLREPTRAVRPGEVLIAGHPIPKRTEFLGDRGLRATAVGSNIVLDAMSGKDVVVGTPWFLVPLRMPWPGTTPLISFVIWSAIDRLRARRRNS